ncbi:MAG TPA: methyltransferase domain-containing protein [Desulfatirhabdiaceae bacterium]|nr:methyltransferase domain-containing protein [Desulfatirhabdiaceae bacterium]
MSIEARLMHTVDFSKLQLKEGNRILDIGCGSGRHCAAAYECPNVSVVGMDMNMNDVLKARERLVFHEQWGRHGGGGWALSIADAGSLPFMDSSFHAVICSEVLEHIETDTRVLTEIYRILKPGKILAVSVPRYYPERICWALSAEYHQTPGGHIRIYRKPLLVGKLKQAGFIVLHSHHAHSLHTPYWWLKCAIGPDKDDVCIVKLVHRILTWDLMKKPAITRFLDRLLNPVLGKSLVLYAVKSA